MKQTPKSLQTTRPCHMKRARNIFGFVALGYVSCYLVLSLCGRYESTAMGADHVEAWAWAPLGFYDAEHPWRRSSYAVHHPTEKTGGWRMYMFWTFAPLWLLDHQFIHSGR